MLCESVQAKQRWEPAAQSGWCWGSEQVCPGLLTFEAASADAAAAQGPQAGAHGTCAGCGRWSAPQSGGRCLRTHDSKLSNQKQVSAVDQKPKSAVESSELRGHLVSAAAAAAALWPWGQGMGFRHSNKSCMRSSSQSHKVVGAACTHISTQSGARMPSFRKVSGCCGQALDSRQPGRNLADWSQSVGLCSAYICRASVPAQSLPRLGSQADRRAAWPSSLSTSQQTPCACQAHTAPTSGHGTAVQHLGSRAQILESACRASRHWRSDLWAILPCMGGACSQKSWAGLTARPCTSGCCCMGASRAAEGPGQDLGCLYLTPGFKDQIQDWNEVGEDHKRNEDQMGLANCFS